MGAFRYLVVLIVIHILTAGSVKVSPKLDFGDQSELIQIKKETISGKIKGLRVTVDTSELKESKSSGSDSSSSSESSEKKKTVGVRTDVTFEITSGENDTKTVDEKEIGKDDDNASIPLVPVYKGTPDRGSKKGGPRDPNFNDIWSVKPLENPSPAGIPIYQNPYDDRNRYGGSDNSWKQFPQYAIWTTERYNRKHDQPVYHHRGQYDININQKPPSNFIPHPIHQHDRHCNCKEYPGPFINPQQPENAQQRYKVDDKLDRPFSRTS